MKKDNMNFSMITEKQEKSEEIEIMLKVQAEEEEEEEDPQELKVATLQLNPKRLKGNPLRKLSNNDDK